MIFHITAFLLIFSIDLDTTNGAITIALNSTGKWPDGTIPYRFEDSIRNFTQLTNIMIAMQQIEEFTGGCVRFRKRTTEKDYIIIQDESYTQNRT